MQRSILLLILLSAGACDAAAQSWPTYRHDNRRSGVTEAAIDFPLQPQWVWKSPQPPQTAWTGPAKWDAYSGNADLQSMRNFDPCFYVTADDQAVYFGSSADDAAHALDAKTGKRRWFFATGAAVRLPPTIANQHVLFGSDDGFVYCCDRMTGELIWRRQAASERRSITSNRKIISLWPVRTGVLVDGNRATFAASLVPWKTSYVTTVDTTSGELSGKGYFQSELREVTLQGALLASKSTLYVPQGRAAPLAIDRKDGTLRGMVGQAGGVFCILSEDEQLFAGPPNQRNPDSQIRIADLASKNTIASFSGTDRILVDGNDAWMAMSGTLRRLDRAAYVEATRVLDGLRKSLKDKPDLSESIEPDVDAAKQKQDAAWKWTIESDVPLDMIKAGNVILLGLNEKVRALSADDGHEVWSVPIEGGAHGLAVAGGQLYVSTDRGYIYAFGAKP